MTDTRLVEGFLTNPKIDAISDSAFRAYTLGLVWSTAQGTDGLIPGRALRYLHPEGADHDLVKELVSARLWEPVDGGWLIHDYLDYQTPAAQVEQARELARLRKQKQRERDQNKEKDKGVTRDKPRDGQRDETRDLQGQDRTVDRTGKDAFEGNNQPTEASPATDAEQLLQARWETAHGAA